MAVNYGGPRGTEFRLPDIRHQPVPGRGGIARAPYMGAGTPRALVVRAFVPRAVYPVPIPHAPGVGFPQMGRAARPPGVHVAPLRGARPPGVMRAARPPGVHVAPWRGARPAPLLNANRFQPPPFRGGRVPASAARPASPSPQFSSRTSSRCQDCRHRDSRLRVLRRDACCYQILLPRNLQLSSSLQQLPPGSDGVFFGSTRAFSAFYIHVIFVARALFCW